MRYYRARLMQERDDILYRVYMADSLYYYARGKGAGKRLSDMLQDADKPQQHRTGDEIAADIIKKTGIKVV